MWERESVGESVCEFAQQKLQFREKKEYVDGGWKWKCGASFWNDCLTAFIAWWATATASAFLLITVIEKCQHSGVHL